MGMIEEFFLFRLKNSEKMRIVENHGEFENESGIVSILVIIDFFIYWQEWSLEGDIGGILYGK